MQLLKVQTARFADVVQNCGAPEVVALWSDPQRDKTFQRAVREHRIMTVHQTIVGGKKDFGEIGFVRGTYNAYLLFPKSLERWSGKRIVGIDYGLLSDKVEPSEKEKTPSHGRTGKTATKKKPEAGAPQRHRRGKSGEGERRGDGRATRATSRAQERLGSVVATVAPDAGAMQMLTPPKDAIDPFMRTAIEEAHKSRAAGGIPIGAALVRDGKLIASGHNKRVQDNDPVTHAETDCLRNAGRLGSFRGCTLYSTLMPCYFCAGAAVQFGIRRVIAGESRNFAGAPDFLREHGIEVIDLDLDECREMMAHFIRQHPRLWREDIGA
jgi:creatinine deaminase